jgi:hypothetical protein
MSEPARQERLSALRANHRLASDDPRLPLSALLGDRFPLSALLAENLPASREIVEKDAAPHAHEHGLIVAQAANANARSGREKR